MQFHQEALKDNTLPHRFEAISVRAKKGWEHLK